jgi:hypothetical protein
MWQKRLVHCVACWRGKDGLILRKLCVLTTRYFEIIQVKKQIPLLLVPCTKRTQVMSVRPCVLVFNLETDCNKSWFCLG